MAFKTIETQEQFDEAIKERLERESKKYEGYMNPSDVAKLEESYKQKLEEATRSTTGYAKQIEDLNKSILEKDSKISQYETSSVKMRVALANGLPYEMASRLNGSTEEEIQADAEKLVKLFNVNNQGSFNKAPQASTTKANAEDGVTKYFKEMNPNLKL